MQNLKGIFLEHLKREMTKMPTAKKVIAYAKKYVRKAPYRSPNAFTRWYGFGGQAVSWCAIFVYYCLAHTGGKTLMSGCSNKAYCPTIWNWGKKKGYAHGSGSQARLGDLVLFDWQKDGVCDHIGFVIKDNGNGTVTTVEGNTSNTNNGNGGCVQIRTRNKSIIKGFIRLPYEKEKKIIGRGLLLRDMPARNKPVMGAKKIRTVKKGTKVICYKTARDSSGRVYWMTWPNFWIVFKDKKTQYIKRTDGRR